MKTSSFLTVLFLVACGSEGGNGPPQSGAQEDDSAIVPSVFGTCEKLCCSDADCGEGSCRAFDTTLGTLGTCSQASEVAPSSLSPSCYLPADAECDPLAGSGCAEGESCDFDPGDAQLDPVVMCFAGIQGIAPGDRCDAVYGPGCGGTYHCRPEGS